MTKKDDDSIALIQKQAQLLMDRNFPVLVELLNGFKYSGRIIHVSADFVEIKDKKIGFVPLFYHQIKVIAPMPNEKEEGEYE